MGGASLPETPVHLLITQGDIELMNGSPEAAMQEMELRATKLGSVLEQILRETNEHLHWGINE